jgi:serine/threonine-protein kinase
MPLEKLGPYKLEKLLGRGGMGAVYIGHNEATGDRAAVKLLAAHLADDPNFRERFKQEIETLKRLLHPNIVQLHGYGEEDGHLYYVMELIEGRCLQDELSAGRRFDWREVARIGIAIAQALKHAHDRGIIHRDLKPANLMIDRHDHIKLADFGIAKLYGGANVTAEGGVLGTADYMSPEQSLGKPVNARCDLYSLGSVMYALLTGRPPFAASTVVEVINALHHQKPLSVRNLAPDTPEEFDNLILQLLEKDPHKRIPTALALANQLKAMEHALNLDTRVMEPTDSSDPTPLLGRLDSSLFSAKTDFVNPAVAKTAPLVPENECDVHRHGADYGTRATGIGGPAAASGRTSMSTQAGKRTGIGESSSRRTDVGTIVPAALAQAEAARISQFTSVSEADLRGESEADDSPHKQWLLTAILALVGIGLIAAAIYFATRPPSADGLYATVKAAADRGGPNELASVEGELNRFVQLFPDDPRVAEMKALAADLEEFRLARRLELGAKRGDLGQELTPIELAYQRAQQLANTDPEAAVEHFAALIAVFHEPSQSNGNEHEQRIKSLCIELARKQLARLSASVQSSIADQKSAIHRQLDRAEQLAAANRPEADKIWEGVITLYRDKRWAKELVETARRRLNELPAATEPAGNRD